MAGHSVVTPWGGWSGDRACTLVQKPCFSTLRPRQNGRRFADDIFKCIFVNENVSISIKNPLKFVPNGPINNIPALVQIMAWRRPGDKPLSEPMMVYLPMHICVTGLQWVNRNGRVWGLEKTSWTSDQGTAYMRNKWTTWYRHVVNTYPVNMHVNVCVYVTEYT